MMLMHLLIQKAFLSIRLELLFSNISESLRRRLLIKGEEVEEGQLIGNIPDGELGANIHASITGKVKEVTERFISIEY